MRLASSGVVGAALLVLLLTIAPSCATGDSDTPGELTSSPQDAAIGPDGCPPCGEGLACSAGACVPSTTDADGDGIAVALDCDDHDRSIFPGAKEVCNGRDDNCNGKVDEGFDADGDGVPTCAVGTMAADCDDNNPAVKPGAAEVCNDKDDDCNGVVDEGFDKDNDGYYACVHGTIEADCDDNEQRSHPGGTEACNGKDDDCNGKVDDIPKTLSSTNASASLSTPIDTHWVLAGSAAFGANLPSPSTNPGWVRLNDDLPDQSGGLWWNAQYLFDTFDMTASFWIQNKAGGDGLAFAWIAGANLTALGAGPAYGVGAIAGGGYAVAIDTFQNTGEGAAPFVSLVNTNQVATPIASVGNIGAVRDAQLHALRVKLTAGKVSVWIDGIARINDVAIPGYVPFTGHWGFTGGTGGVSEAHWVTNVNMSFPTQGCVP